MAQTFDFEAFERYLERSVAEELEAQREKLAPHTLRVLALDCHPWHGILDLAASTTEDEAELDEMGDWDLYPLADRESTSEPWARLEPWREAMQEYWEAQGDDKFSATTQQFLQCCAQALASEPVRKVVATLNRSEDFQLWVSDPDDPEQKNLCAGVEV